jgi:large subunit ribosomal protein L9e
LAVIDVTVHLLFKKMYANFFSSYYLIAFIRDSSLFYCFHLLLIIVTVESKCRDVTVTGPLGTLKRSFKHMQVDCTPVEVDGKRTLKVDIWFGTVASKATLRTLCSHIENMITGVTKGFKYKMRFCYAHFPINASSVKNGASETVEIRNFLGEKKVRRIELLEGVNYVKTADVKDQIEISGIDITKVSLSCARISQATNCRNKDIRKFLDGIYVSEKGVNVTEE